jgi:DNA-3-methyladenine glycosylase II
VDYQRARRHLMRRDPVLGAVIKRVGPCRLGEIPALPPFMALAEAIASQQLSVKAADTIFGRFCGLFGDCQPDPARLLELDAELVRGVGFSRSKVLFLRDLAAHMTDKRLELEELHLRDDEQVVAQLTAVKGIGVWTAEIFLMFRLQRPDIFPADDLGLVKAAQRVYGLRQRPTRARLLAMAEAWRPYRSVAAWYLWRSLSLQNEELRTKNEERNARNKQPRTATKNKAKAKPTRSATSRRS